MICISYLQLDIDENKSNQEKSETLNIEMDKQLNAIKSQYRKSSAASAMMVAKNVVLEKRESE